MDEIYVRGIRGFPRSVEAVTVLDGNGDYNVYVNAAMPPERQRRAWRHELVHIRQGHFQSPEPVVINELEAEL